MNDIRRVKILLIDDNPDDTFLTLRTLRTHKITEDILVIHDGEEALEWLKNTATPPELVLLDLNLPKVSGIDILIYLKSNSRTQSIPVVVLTGSMDQRDLVENYSRNANGYIEKPLDFARFVETVRDIGLTSLLVE